MILIGIVGENRYHIMDMLCQFLEKKEKQKKHQEKTILILLPDETEKTFVFSKMQFDILICVNRMSDKIKQIIAKQEKKETVLILDSDTVLSPPFNIHETTTVITCGLNARATVTASSMQEDEKQTCIQVCLQREITTVSNRAIEPQEFQLKIKDCNKSVVEILSAITAAILCDMEIPQMDAILL